MEFRVVTVGVYDLQYEPGETRKSATTVNTSKMLRRGRGGKVRIDTMTV